MFMLYYVMALALSDKYVHGACYCTLGIISIPQICEHLFDQDRKAYTSCVDVCTCEAEVCTGDRRNLMNSRTQCFSSTGLQMWKNLSVVSPGFQLGCFTCLETGDGTGPTGARGFVRGVYVLTDVVITRSRLSTSALKPEIMGTSMTAMLDEPEWSHLDRKFRFVPIKLGLCMCVLGSLPGTDL